ncbi:MAG TPA: L,D-transpeptidase family protein [Chloroflexia bacterium]|nr:L,D-transpeptidase family protein [Chloroflexia bacterium]
MLSFNFFPTNLPDPGLKVESRRTLQKWAAYPYLLAFALVSSLLLTAFAPLSVIAADSPNPAISAQFADSHFYSAWERTDYPVATQQANRSWYWGPKPLGGGLQEQYAGSGPSGKRLVQYFDKARMEINDPARPQNVTNGLLVVELITGKMQLGDASFENTGAGAAIPVAGDLNNSWPTYAALSAVFNLPSGLKLGEAVQTSFTKEGKKSQTAYPGDGLTRVAVIRNNFGIPAAFWNFLNGSGTVYRDGQYGEDTVSDWLSSTGLPVTEAYWTRLKVAGQEKDVMFQAFERRVLTYTPSNPQAFRVEMGNVGAHYVNWRYQGKLPPLPAPPMATNPGNPGAGIFGGSQPEWYEVTGDVLNVRTGPSTSFPPPTRTQNLPYLTQLVKGNRIQVLRKVEGEELEDGNATWYQFYENPDLYVYSAYTQKLTLPQMPVPPRSFNGLWVAVSLSRQMMAVYDGPKLLYRTLISSGVPNDLDPTRDYRTPKGTFKIDGSYRPKSQTMEGGSRASASYYKLEQVRNVSYFYQDYSIHGTYWHARFGTYPQSHGCVNATVYDAGLIYQLKAGTTVYVY